MTPQARRYTHGVSWLGRLFNPSPRTPAPPPPNSVLIPDELATRLDGDPEQTLQERVELALRDLIEIRRRAAEHDDAKLPFWLRRDGGGGPEIDESLRDRVSQRRAADNEGS